MAMWGGNRYGNTTDYVGWTTTTATSITLVPTAPAPRPRRPKTNIEWLRERVEEICALACPEAI